jgi:hypothetical protein
MTRVAILLFLVFAVLLALRLLRILVEAFWKGGTRRASPPPPALEGEMVRDPVCGTWIDRRLALAARNADGWVPVCSEACRARLQGT